MYDMKIIKRLIFILFIWVPMLNITLESFMLLPYWVITGKITYESKLFKFIDDWYFNLIKNKL